MNLILLLHFYQPFNQQQDILYRIIEESYMPLLDIFTSSKDSKITVNLSGSLISILEKSKSNAVLKSFKNLYVNNKIELTRSAMYHPLLPLLPKDEIKQQITLNDTILERYFKNFKNKPSGFFSPELAVNGKLLHILNEMNTSWIIASQMSYNKILEKKPLRNDLLYVDKKTKLNVFFRSKLLSSLILSATIHSVDDLLNEVKDIDNIENKYFFLVMDAETFGHHRVGHEKFLKELLNDPRVNTFTPSMILQDKSNIKSKYINIRPSTWTNSEQDFWLDKEQSQYTEKNSFILWNDPTNPIHKLQWKLTYFAIKCVKEYDKKNNSLWKKARDLLDKALASDQYWWASSKPWWSLEMIELGAFSLKEVIDTLPNSHNSHKKAAELYHEILDKAFYWQRSGYIRKQHTKDSATYFKTPFKDRTPNEWFNQVILEFEYEMKLAESKQDYEKAIKWRDAIIKLSLGTDIYDVLHVVDELWLGRNVKWAAPQVKPFLSHSWNEFSTFAKEHFLNCSSEKEFNEWKKKKQNTKKE